MKGGGKEKPKKRGEPDKQDQKGADYGCGRRARQTPQGELANGQKHSADEDEASGDAEGRGVGEFFGGKAETDADGVEGGGGEEEAGGVEEAAGVGGHLGAVGEAVEEGEEADDGGAGPKGQADGEGDEKTEEQDGGEDAGFDHGEVEAGHAKRAAEGHDADEAGGDGPDGTTAELGGPEADGDHGEEVVEAVDGVIDAVEETVDGTGSGVRVGQRG